MATRRHFERPAAVDALGARGFVAALTVSQKTQSDLGEVDHHLVRPGEALQACREVRRLADRRLLTGIA